MSDNQPKIETNDENLDRPWAWLMRVPCLYFNELGNPYSGTAELRVSLLNHEHTEDDPFVPPIQLSGLFPFGPISESSKAESMGGYSLTPSEARGLAAGLLRAADHEEGGGQPERTCPNCEWAESECVCKSIMAKCNRAERMLERILAGFEVAMLEPERSYDVFTDMHDGLVHFLAHESVDGLGDDCDPTAETYQRLAAWALRRVNTLAAIEDAESPPKKAKRDRILDGLKGQNELAALGDQMGFWCQPDAVLVEGRTAGEAIQRYRSIVAAGDVGISHNHHTDAIRALRAERGDTIGDGTRLPDGPVMATWWGELDQDSDGRPLIEVLFYRPALSGNAPLWSDCEGGTWSRDQLEAEIADHRLRVKPLPPGLAEPANLVGEAR